MRNSTCRGVSLAAGKMTTACAIIYVHIYNFLYILYIHSSQTLSHLVIENMSCQCHSNRILG